MINSMTESEVNIIPDIGWEEIDNEDQVRCPVDVLESRQTKRKLPLHSTGKVHLEDEMFDAG